MANLNSRVNIKKVKNVSVIDPNSNGKENVNVEDLSISVELEVFERGEEPIIFSDGDYTKVSQVDREPTRISFIDGAGNNTYLTTDYTSLDINFDRNKKDVGSLGIESIDISFNSSYTPIVNIKFKDVRAKLFQLGSESPYAFLFRMPYPIFYLTIKGYYGKPVKYALHLTKFNGELDNDTGSYIITCDFIGYTYAFLSDLLMGLLKGIPYTQEGLSIINSKEEFITFKDLVHLIGSLETDILQYRNTNKELNSLSVYDELIDKLEKIESILYSNLTNLSEGFIKMGDTNVYLGDMISISSINDSINKTEKENYINETLKLIKEYNVYNQSKGDNTFNLNEDKFKLNEGGIYYEKFKLYDFTIIDINTSLRRFKTYEEFQDSVLREKYQNFKTLNDKNDVFRKDYYTDLIEILSIKYKFGDNIIDLSINIIDIRFTHEYIKNLKDKIYAEYSDKESLVKEDFTNTIDNILNEGPFNASVGSLFKILCGHVDLFIKVLKNIENKIKNDSDNGRRNISLGDKNNFTELTSIDNLNEVPVGPFPEYIIKEKLRNEEEGGMIETWLGSNPKFSNFQEVIFINDLYHGMMKAAKEDRKFTNQNFASESRWYPVNPLETTAFNPNNTNPWELISDAPLVKVMKLMLQRMTLFLGYGYKNLSEKEIINMAIIEANQAYSSISNENTKKALAPVGSTEQNLDSIINKYIGDFINNFGDVGETYGLRFHKEGENLIYQHDMGGNMVNEVTFKNDARELKAEYIPITQEGRVLNQKFNELNEFSVRINTNTTFISNLSTDRHDPADAIRDSYETFIKIINGDDYKKEYSYNNYLGMSFPSTTAKLSKGTPIKNVNSILGGTYKTHEFYTYEDEQLGLIPFFYEFYGNVLKKDIINRDTGREYNPFIPTFESNKKKFNLFGSKFYYNQHFKGRALLFLHSISFNGFTEIEKRSVFSGKILSLFNERAGFVSTPYTFLLLVGALINRNRREYLILLDDELNNLVPLLKKQNNNKNYNLLTFTGLYNTSGGVGSVIPGKTPISFTDETTSSTAEEITFKRVVSYEDIDSVILNLPKKVQDIFEDEFLRWVDSDWIFLKDKLEVFKTNITNEEIDTLYLDVKQNKPINKSLLSSYYAEGDNFKELISLNDENGNFNIKIEKNSDGEIALFDLLKSYKIIINGTHLIWNDGGVDKFKSNFIIKESDLRKYTKTFFTTIRDLNSIDEDRDIKYELFDTDNVDDIKLSIYKNVKSIYYKWVIGVHPTQNSVILNELYRSFSFLDRAYNDISQDFKISPTGFVDYLVTNSNISFYNFISRILSGNNFDFIPLPTFIDYSSEEEVKSIFEPIRFKDMAETEGPKFICMYFGEQSSKLNIDKNKKNKTDDSFRIDTKYDNNGEFIISDYSEIPTDYRETNQNIPYFLVNYADQNQSLFKKIRLNQNEFTETNESLQIIENISNMNRNNSIGQNLFDIYNNRAYSAEVEMLGCAQIQPFMFFQINNIPMFDGAYSIINTRHSITPNHMVTTFKGVRIRRVKTKMVNSETIYAHLLTNLEKVGNDSANLRNFDGYESRVNKNKKVSLKQGNVDFTELIEESTKGVDDRLLRTFSNPLENILVTSDYGVRDLKDGFHIGTDFSADIGTDVIAVDDLEVRRVRWEPKGGGLYVDFKVNKEEIYIRYMHLSELTHEVFKNIENYYENMDNPKGTPIGMIIKKGKVFARTGDTGGVFPHLHIDIRNNVDILDRYNYKEPQLFFNTSDWRFAPNQIKLHF